jgi:hypothetical protein
MLATESKEQKSNSEDTWVSCCFRCHKGALVYFTQLTIALIVIIFCIVKLILSQTCETDQLYSGILMLEAGTFRPNPKISHVEN